MKKILQQCIILFGKWLIKGWITEEEYKIKNKDEREKEIAEWAKK